MRGVFFSAFLIPVAEKFLRALFQNIFICCIIGKMVDDFVSKMDLFFTSLREDAESDDEQVIGRLEGL